MQHCHVTHFTQWQITDISVVNEYFVCIYVHTALGFATIKFNNICVSQFVALQCCYHDDIAIFATFSFLHRGIDGSWDEFSGTQVGKTQGPFELVIICQYPPEVSHYSSNWIPVSSGMGLTFNTNDVFLFLKFDGNYIW